LNSLFYAFVSVLCISNQLVTNKDLYAFDYVSEVNTAYFKNFKDTLKHGCFMDL